MRVSQTTRISHSFLDPHVGIVLGPLNHQLRDSGTEPSVHYTALFLGQISLQSLLMQLVMNTQGRVTLEEDQRDKLTYPFRKRLPGGCQKDQRLGELAPTDVLNLMIVTQVLGHAVHVGTA